MSFGKWDPSVHDNFEQLKRRVSAAKIAEDDIELDPANQTARIYGSDPEPYLVTLEECSCYDFQSATFRASTCTAWLWNLVAWMTFPLSILLQKKSLKIPSWTRSIITIGHSKTVLFLQTASSKLQTLF